MSSEYAGVVAAIEEARAALAQPVSAESAGWTDADSDAARLALELECLLSDKDVPMPALSRWWNSAHEALELHRARMRATPPASAERVPLTDEQIEQIAQSVHGMFCWSRYDIKFARAIERAHGITC